MVIKFSTPIPLETATQRAFVQWVRLQQNNTPLLALGFAVPNGGKRSIRTAIAMKAEGALSGVPDWLLPVPSGTHIGLAIEFKRAKSGYLSDNQKSYITLLQSVGWKVLVLTCHTVAIEEVKKYLLIGK